MSTKKIISSYLASPMVIIQSTIIKTQAPKWTSYMNTQEKRMKVSPATGTITKKMRVIKAQRKFVMPVIPKYKAASPPVALSDCSTAS
jgi:hypothetical protein